MPRPNASTRRAAVKPSRASAPVVRKETNGRKGKEIKMMSNNKGSQRKRPSQSSDEDESEDDDDDRAPLGSSEDEEVTSESSDNDEDESDEDDEDDHTGANGYQRSNGKSASRREESKDEESDDERLSGFPDSDEGMEEEDDDDFGEGSEEDEDFGEELDESDGDVMESLERVADLAAMDEEEDSKDRRKQRREARAAVENAGSGINPRSSAVGSLSKKTAATSEDPLSLEDLLSAVENSTSHAAVKKHLQSTSRVSAVVAAPSKTVLDRAERKVGFAHAKEQVSQWQSIVKANREAPSVSFPLNAAAPEKPTVSHLARDVVQQPRTDLERQVAEILKANGMSSDTQVLSREKAEITGLLAEEDPEAIERRRAELSKNRALMFYEEQRAKRVKKIKSKTFRKLNRKREAHAQDVKEGEVDPKVLARAEERMSLRHKNTSRNMRELARRGLAGESLKQRNDILRSKMTTEDDSDDSSASDDSTSQDESEEEEENAKGVFALEFMKRAKAEESLKRRIESGKDVEAVEQALLSQRLGRRSYGAPAENEDGDDDEEEEQQKEVSRAPPTKRARMAAAQDSSEDEREEARSSVPSAAAAPAPAAELIPELASNPWLQPSAAAGKSSRASKSAPESNITAIRVDELLTKLPAAGATDAEDDDEDDATKRESRKKNAEMIKRAFADVAEADFEEEKRAALEADAPEAESELPGWGSWTGMGVAKKAKKPAPTPASAPKSKILANANVAGLKHVIVSEKAVNKSAQKYLVDKIPYPFTSREQYLRSLAQPLGPEWNTRSRFAKNVLPETIVKVGAIVDPIKLSAKKRKMAVEASQNAARKTPRTLTPATSRSSKKL